MALVPYEGFIGPSNVLQAIRADDERTINWYLEQTQPGSGKVPWWLVPTPGLKPFAVATESPVRALFAQDGRCFAVIGPTLYEVFATQTLTSLGTVQQDGQPATISSGGTAADQLFITSNGKGFTLTLSTNAFAQITDPDFLLPSAMGAFVDGYFVNLQAESRKFQISALEDATSWASLDVAEVSQSSDNLLAMVAFRRELHFIGSQTKAVWTNIGAADFPFAPIPGSLIPYGIAGRFSWGISDNQLYWVGSSPNGSAIVYQENGSNPLRVSTHAVEDAFTADYTLADTLCWSYLDRGHNHLLFYIPEAETTWTYDSTTRLWHERALWDPTALSWTPHLGRCHTYAFGTHLVGDRKTGAIYQMSADYLTDGVVS